MYQNLTQLSCQNFPDILDYYYWPSPFNNSDLKFYGLSKTGNGQPTLCGYNLESRCHNYFSNMSSNAMKFFLPSFEQLILNNYIDYKNPIDINDVDFLMFYFFFCFYCTNETNLFKTEYYPKLISQSNVIEVRNSHWILKGELYTLPFYYSTKFVSHCNNLKDLNDNDNVIYLRDSCHDGKTTIFEITNSKVLMSVELVLFTLQCLVTFALVTVPIFYGWAKRWNFNKMDVGKTLKIWRIVTDMRMTATTYLQLSTLFLVIVSAKVIGDTTFVYNFDDYNLTLLLAAFEMSVMANIPIIAMFIDTLRRTEKNEKETSIGLTVALFFICVTLLTLIIVACIICFVLFTLYYDAGILSYESIHLFRPVFFIISVGFVGILISILGLYSFKIYFQLKKYSKVNFFQFKFSKYLIMFIFIFLMGVTVVGFEISMAVNGSSPTLEFDLLRFRIYAYFVGIFNWSIFYMLFSVKGLVCYCEMLLYLIIRPCNLSSTKIGQKIISLTVENK
ncbi:hypothetical protein ABK040_005222 [Willaertia magna]